MKGFTGWSPDGKRMLLDVAQPDPTTGFRDPETWEIYVMNADGTGLKNLSNRPGKDNSARWSPDGKLIVFESIRTGYYGTGAGDIYVMDADGTNVRRLTDDPADDMLPRWSPDGKWISFTSYRGIGLERRKELIKAKAEEMGFTIPPEDLEAWAVGVGGGVNVWMMKADGSEVQHVVKGWGGYWSACEAQR